MTQAATWNTITAGPANMSQVQARTSDSFNAILTNHSGASRPAYAVAHTTWLKIVSSTAWELYLYDGTNDILIGTFNPVADTFTLSATALGFNVSAVARNDVTPLSLINGRANFTVGSNGEGILNILGRSSGNGDEAAIRWLDGVGGTAQRFKLQSNQSTSLRLLDASSVEFFEFLATGELESKLFGNLSEQIVPRGAVVHGPWTSAPPGFVTCSGALVSRTTYAALWTAVQARGKLVSDATWLAGSFGAFSTGDGSTTFRLPQLNTDFVRSLYQEGGGFTIGLWQIDANKSHSHAVTDPQHAHGFVNTIGGFNGNAAQAGVTAHASASISQTTVAASTGISIQSQGETEGRPRNVSLLACIKV